MQIDEIVEQNKVWTITLLIKCHNKDGDRPDYNWINSVQQKLELFDAKGNNFNRRAPTILTTRRLRSMPRFRSGAAE